MAKTAFNPFGDTKANEIKDDIIKTLRSCAQTTSFQTVFRWWVKTMAITIQNGCLPEGSERWNALEKEYLGIVESAGAENIRRFCEAFGLYVLLLEVCPFADWLGCLYMELASAGEKGQFFTPYGVSQACAQMAWSDADAESDEPMTFNEPACGSGGMIIAWLEYLHSKGIAWQRRARVTCSDIDECCVHMSYVTLSLLGVRAEVLHQNTLTLQTWSVWHTPKAILWPIMDYGVGLEQTESEQNASESSQNASELISEQKTDENTSEPERRENRKSEPKQLMLF